MEKLKEKLLNLLEINEKDIKIIKNYLNINDIDDLFQNYKELNISNDTKDQIQSLIIILENQTDM